jgi:hypothetical protein
MKVQADQLQVASLSWCDVALTGVTWSENGRDVILLLLPATPDREGLELRKMICKWTSELKMEISLGRLTGRYPMTWNVTFDRDSQNGWRVHFDFASNGMMSFRCSEIDIRLASVQKQ